MNFHASIHRRGALALALASQMPRFAFAQRDGQAVIAERAEGGGPGGGIFFMVSEINGKAVSDTSFEQSRRASFGRGAHMVVRVVEHPLPAGPTSVTLRGFQGHVAPIDSIFRAVFLGGNPEVKGTVTVDLAPGKRYRVNGVLDAYAREVWLEDDQGAVVPGSKVAVPPDPALIKQMEGAAFTRTNLHYENDWISEVPWLQQPLVPVGSRLKVVEWSKHKAAVLIDGRKMRLGVDESRAVESIQQFVARVTTTEDPRDKIAAYPEPVRNAIRAGRVLPGMTREQAEIAVGRPRVDFVPDLNATEWRYQGPEQEELFLVFDAAGLLKEIDASRRTRQLVQYDPR